MRYSAGTVAVTPGGNLFLVTSHIRRKAVTVAIVRGEPTHRCHVPLAGRVDWSDVGESIPGCVVCNPSHLWAETMLRPVGNAGQALMSAILKAQIRELEARDEPVWEEVAAEFREADALRHAVEAWRPSPANHWHL